MPPINKAKPGYTVERINGFFDGMRTGDTAKVLEVRHTPGGNIIGITLEKYGIGHTLSNLKIINTPINWKARLRGK